MAAASGIDSPLKFFWATGALSSFLDNSPTYVVFLTTAGSLGADGMQYLTTAVGDCGGPPCSSRSLPVPSSWARSPTSATPPTSW